MAQTHYRTLFRKVLLGFISEQDPVLPMLEWVAQMMMQIEAESRVGAEKGKHTKDRKTYFSGARVRRMDTRLGKLYLYIPKLRKGSYIPFFITERKRSELALMTLIQEAFINGVSTRRIERLAKAIGIENISAAQVSEITKGLEDQVTSFRTRHLEEEYPFVCQDYEKRFPAAVRCLKEGLEDSLRFFGFPEIDDKKISSTNMPERTSREVRRRSRVIGVFPTVDSWVRLVTCYLVEYSEDWGIDRSYIKKEKIQEAMERDHAFLMAQAAN